MGDPFKTLSRGVAAAAENTPAVVAMRAGESIIPNTWGHVASQLVEMNEVEPTVEAVCDFLMITPDDLRSDRLDIHSGWGTIARGYFNKLQNRMGAEYVQAHAGHLERFLAHIDRVSEGWQIEDGPARYEVIQKIIERNTEEGQRLDDQARATMARLIRGAKRTDEDERAIEAHLKHRLEQNLLCTYRDAAYDGKVTTLADFIGTMLNYPDQTFWSEEDILAVIKVVVDQIAHERFLDGVDAKVESVHIGQADIDTFKAVLQGSFDRKAWLYALARWERIRPLFFTPDPRSHPLLSGRES